VDVVDVAGKDVRLDLVAGHVSRVQLFRLVINYDCQRTGGMTSSSISSREILYR